MQRLAHRGAVRIELLADHRRLVDQQDLAADGLQLPFADRSFDLVTASHFLHHFSEEDAKRILRAIVFSNFKMKVRSTHPSCSSHEGDDFSLRHPLPLLNQIDLVVGINRDKTAGVPNNHNISIAPQSVTVKNFTVGNRSNGCSLWGCDIDTVVEACPARAEA